MSKTLINGAAYDVGGGITLLNGTSYHIQKGRTLIGGTGYDISFGTKVADLAVGTEVYMNVGGTRTAFTVVHQGNPDASIYDASCNGTWVLAKALFAPRQWNVGGNSYADSLIHTYLNSTFLDLFDAGIKMLIKQVKIPYRAGYGISTVVTDGADGLSTKIFLLSSEEVGAYSASFSTWAEGANLEYFTAGSMTQGNKKRIAYYNGEAEYWSLRTPSCYKDYATTRACVIADGGEIWTRYCDDNTCFRPAMILSSSAKVDDSMNIIG